MQLYTAIKINTFHHNTSFFNASLFSNATTHVIVPSENLVNEWTVLSGHPWSVLLHWSSWGMSGDSLSWVKFTCFPASELFRDILPSPSDSGYQITICSLVKVMVNSISFGWKIQNSLVGLFLDLLLVSVKVLFWLQCILVSHNEFHWSFLPNKSSALKSQSVLQLMFLCQ